MMTERQQLERGFTTQDGGVDMVRMSKIIPAHEWRKYIDLCREERKATKPLKPGRFNA